MVDFILRLARAYGSLGLAIQAAAVVALALITTAVGMAMVVYIPSDYFRSTRPPERPVWWRRHPVLLGCGLLVKNSVGILFVIAGAIMALPLVPGPGLLFMLLGFSLLDFPGKRTVERKLLAIPAVLRSLNAIRVRFKRPPLILDDPPTGTGPAGAQERR